MPLCTKPTFSLLKCGWALRSAGTPWVAQRVCAIPRLPISGCAAKLASNTATLPTERVRTNSPWVLITATPAESYPRYSSRRKPSNKISTIGLCATAPTIPHIIVSP